MEGYSSRYCFIRRVLLGLLVFSFCSVSGQSWLERNLPKSGAGLQYAGSTGFVTAGYFRASMKQIVQTGLQYGWTPETFGGPLHSLSVKFIYNPFSFALSEHVRLEPLQAGVFVSQNFGKRLGVFWPESYPFMYYWWPRATRTHVFTGLTLSVKGQMDSWLDHSAYYIEANTNDLYLSSYFNKKNYRSLSISDIFFLGAGLRLYWR